jgi:glycosyltransferase involved in cell wall biosynthesis
MPARRGGPVAIVSCGRLDPGKGHADLIEAVSILVKNGIDATLTILGEGPQRSVLENLRKPLGERVKLPGATAEGGVRAALESANIFALASHDEAIGVATMEAMSMELPVIVTRVGGVPDLVRDGIDGLLVKAGTPGAIAGAVERLLDDPDRAAQMGQNGAARIRRSFTSRVSAEALARRLGVSEAPAAAAVAVGSA